MAFLDQFKAVAAAAPARALLAVETALTFPVFVVSWWCCALYRAVIAGWHMSDLKTPDKRAMINQALMRNPDPDTQ